jgi:hypothetical protein
MKNIKIINNFSEPVKLRVKKKLTFWEKFDKIINLILY